MDITIKKALRVLVVSALMLLMAGSAFYYLGSQINVDVQNSDPTVWEQSPGDKWLFIGGLMMLIAGSLSLAAMRIWLGRRKPAANSSLNGLRGN
jgi:cytochrome c oxidase assembly factor CtaG